MKSKGTIFLLMIVLTICVMCAGIAYCESYPEPGLYVNEIMELSWDQLIEYNYIKLENDQITEINALLYGRLVVKEGISIYGSPFYDTALDEIYMPDTYTVIGSKDFKGAGANSIVFFGQITEIMETSYDGAFSGSSIQEFTFPEGIKRVPEYCFYGCESLENVNLPNTLESLGNEAFHGCKSLKSIHFPDSLVTIGNNCFTASGLKTVSIPQNVNTIGKEAFSFCDDLEYANLYASGVTELEKTFLYCPNLKTVSLPHGLVNSSYSFGSDNSLEYLVLPDSVESFTLNGNAGFYPIESLKWVVWPVKLMDASGFEAATHLETVYFRGSEFMWGLVNGKIYKPPFGQDTDIFENTVVVCNATEADWSERLQYTDDCQASQRENVPASSVGSLITFGRYPQTAFGMDSTPIEWVVLDYDATSNRALLISKYALDVAPYDPVTEGATWASCSLRNQLNNLFLNKAFTTDEQKAILTVSIDNSSSQSGGWDAEDSPATLDKVFLLSFHEVDNVYFQSNEARICTPTDYALTNFSWRTGYDMKEFTENCIWWLRTAGKQNGAGCVDGYGITHRDDGTEEVLCVRPVIWVDMEKVKE